MRGLVLSLFASFLLYPSATWSQDFAWHAISFLPSQTVRVEYVNLAKLRTLPKYASLRERFVGPRLGTFAKSLFRIGVAEDEIEELVLAWLPGATKGNKELSALARGRFNWDRIADRAKVQAISPLLVAGRPAFCMTVEGEEACVVVLDDSLATFGTATGLGTLLVAGAGRDPNAVANPRFVNLAGEVRAQPPVWGIAFRDALSDWFGAWLSGRFNLSFDWVPMFQSVEALVYSVDAGEKVAVDLKLDCSTAEASARMRDTLEGLKQLQQLAWQGMNPSAPNPINLLEVRQSGQRILVSMTANYPALGGR